MKLFSFFFILACTSIAVAQTNQTLPEPGVTISAIQPGVGQSVKCLVNGKWVLVQGVPSATVTAYNQMAKLQAEVKPLADWIEREDSRIAAAQANGPAEALSGTPGGDYIRYWNIQANNLREKQKELDRKEAELTRASKAWERVNTIAAQDTGKVYAGMGVWVVRR